MDFTLENIKNIQKQAQQDLIISGYIVVQKRISHAAERGQNEVFIPAGARGINGYIINNEHIKWLKKLGFEVQEIPSKLGCSLIDIRWKD